MEHPNKLESSERENPNNNAPCEPQDDAVHGGALIEATTEGLLPPSTLSQNVSTEGPPTEATTKEPQLPLPQDAITQGPPHPTEAITNDPPPHPSAATTKEPPPPPLRRAYARRPTPQEDKISKQIKKRIPEQRQSRHEQKTILLLGAGESGTSTVRKQLYHGYYGFGNFQRYMYLPVICKNILQSALILLDAVRTLNLQQAQSLRFQEAAARLQALGEQLMQFDGPLTAQHANDLMTLWRDPASQLAFQNPHDCQLPDSASYYFSAIERIAAPDYIPTDEDILRAHAVQSHGYSDLTFTHDGINITIVDVSGQRGALRKWIHCFQDVSAVIFVAALSDYMRTNKDGDGKRLHDSLQLFDEVCNSEFLLGPAMILFLTKDDIFKDNIERVPLRVCFEEYMGPLSYDEGIKFIKKKFMAVNRNENKNIYIHVMCALDTKQVMQAFFAVKDIIVRPALSPAAVL